MQLAKILFTVFLLNVMKIENNYSPTFEAKFINAAKIKKRVSNTSSYIDKAVSMVEIDVHNNKDIDALENIANYWQGQNGFFTTNIYYAACEMKDNNKYFKYNKIFALTKQMSDYDNLDCNQILGVVHVSSLNSKNLFIEHIQVNPQIIYSFPAKYKKIGSELLNLLKSLSDRIICFPSNTDAVKNFYLKNGFIEIPPRSNCFIYQKTNVKL